MDFKLTKEQTLAKELFHKFAENELRPIARDMDEAEEMNFEMLAKLQKAHMLGIPYSKQYGGAGADNLTYTLCMEEVSKIDASTGITISVHTSLCCGCIDQFGTEEQKQEFLRPLVDGSKIGCFGLTEPGAGSDAGGVQTEAVKSEDGTYYTITGTKVFTTNSGFADTFVVFAITDRKAKTSKRLSAFILDRTMEGLSVSNDIPRMGIRAASNCEVIYDNVKVPASRLLGKEGDGFKIAMNGLNGGRIGIAAQSVGIAQGAINEAIKYVQERKQFGKTIASFQNTQFKLAEMQTQVDAARLLTWRAAVAKDNHENYASLAAMAKLFASATANDVTRGCVQLFGGYGFTREYPVERAMRDAKITEIYEGTSEVMKMVISGELLK